MHEPIKLAKPAQARVAVLLIHLRIFRIHSPQRVPIPVITAATTNAMPMRIQNAVTVGSVRIKTLRTQGDLGPTK
jgi:hypothetical protein